MGTLLKLKRPAEAKDAKEVAKKLLKTGAMKAIKKSLEREKSKVELLLLIFSYHIETILHRRKKQSVVLRGRWDLKGN